MRVLQSGRSCRVIAHMDDSFQAVRTRWQNCPWKWSGYARQRYALRGMCPHTLWPKVLVMACWHKSVSMDDASMREAFITLWGVRDVVVLRPAPLRSSHP